MTAPTARYLRDPDNGSLEYLCQMAIDGRRAARRLVQLAERFQLSESELQILLCLSQPTGQGTDQTTLAVSLALSPPQVSACVEKLRVRGLISHHEASGDRRRRLWQVSTEAIAILRQVVAAAGESREAAA